MYAAPVPSRIARVAAPCVIVLGCALAAWAASRFRVAPLPLTLSLIGTGALLVLCGAGIARRARAGWSFAVAVLAVLTIAGLLALPGIVRAGAPPVVAGLALAAVVGVLILLISGRAEL
jgi:hypothetical protein